MPQNIYLMTLEPWRENSYLLRLEHLLEKAEDEKYSKPATFDLLDVFGGLFDIASVRETNLSANQWLPAVKRLKFRSTGNDTVAVAEGHRSLGSDDALKYSITLNPMQIRTFVITTNPKV